MTIGRKEMLRIVSAHDRDMAEERRELVLYDAAYADRFWKGISGERIRTRGDMLDASMPAFRDGDTLVEVNHVRPWLFSFVDSLFHKGIRPQVAPDAIVVPDSPPVDAEAASAISNLLARWLSSSDIEDMTEQGFMMGLMYPEVAFKLGVDDEADNPVDRIWVEVLPPWECVWDRSSRNSKSMRYIGHAYWLPVSIAAETWDIDLDDVRGMPRPDFIADGGRSDSNVDPENPDANYVRVLEFHDFTGEYTLPAEADAEEGEPPTTLDGEMRVYLLQQDEGNFDEPIFTGPSPYTKPDSRPMSNIIPMVLVPMPSTPVKGIPAVSTVWQLNKELNIGHTIFANAARKDSARAWGYKKDSGIDEAVLERLTAGEDGVLVGLEGGDAKSVFPLQMDRPLSPNLSQHIAMMDNARDSTSGLSQPSRGQALKYSTAAEIRVLTDYSETTLGRIRKRGDRAVIRMLHLFMRVLHSVMGDMKLKTITVRNGPTTTEVKREWLDVRWEINIGDQARTPLAEDQRRQDFQLIQPTLQGLYASAREGDASAPVMIRHIVEMYNLPDAFLYENIATDQAAIDQEIAKQQAELAPPEEPPPADGGGIPADDQGVQDIIDAAVESAP